MRRAHKLIKQIREALAANGANAPVETLAAEYTRLLSEAAQRLDSCAEMIEKGSLYQALQLAETEPPLLDLLAALRFGDAQEWDAFCAAQGLPVAPKFDAKAVQALDGLYARGMELSDPLGKDYRAAIGSHNYPKALQITQSKLRLNPHDADARAELERLNNKLFQLKLNDLRGALARGDEAAVLRELTELERLAVPAKLEALREYEEAIEIRRRLERETACELSAQLVSALPAQREAGDWHAVGEALARIRAMQAEHGFELAPEAAASCVEMQGYADAQRATAAEAAHFEAALQELREWVGRIEAERPAALTLPENERLYYGLNQQWKEVQQLAGTAPDELTERVRAAASELRGELERQRRRRQVQFLGAGLTVAAAIGLAGWFAVRAYRVQDYAARLASLRDAGQIEAVEKMSAQLRQENGALAARAPLSTRLDEVERWSRDLRARQSEAEARVAELEQVGSAAFAGVKPLEHFAKSEAAGQLVEALSASLRAPLAERLASSVVKFEAHLGSIRETIIAQADAGLQGLETQVGARLGYDQPKDALVAALAQMEPPLKALEARAHPPLAALELPPAQQERVVALRKRSDLFQAELSGLTRIHDALRETRSLDAYRDALAAFRDSRLTQAAEVNSARKILAAFPTPDEIFASLLMPGNSQGWAAAKVDTGGARFAPEKVLPDEIARLLALREDLYLNNIWEVSLIEYARKNGRRDVYARGDLQKDGPRTVGDAERTTWTGAVFDPALKTEVPAFAPLTLVFNRASGGGGTSGTGEVFASRLSAVSQSLARLELNRMTDATGAQFEKPLLRVFDDLVKDKDASPVFKAFMMQQLATLMNPRPNEWGLQYCPSLRGDLARLAQLCEDVGLRSEDWLLERKRTPLMPKLAPFFAELQTRTYFAEARRHRELVRAALSAGLQFGGYLDDELRPHLFGDANAGLPLWALTQDRTVVRYRPPQEGGKIDDRLAPFSPVFFIPMKRDPFLAGKDAPPAIPFLEP